MKIELLAFLLAFATTVTGRTIKHHSNKKNVIGKARRLEDQNNNNNNNQNQDEEEYGFLMNYKMKMVSCKMGETVRNPENGEYEQNAVVFRLCPSSDGGCDDESAMGCKEGYGDYIVGLNTFVEAYMQDQEENMQQDDNFNVAEYAECRQYEDDNNNGYAYFIGPACTDDGTDIKLELFYDEYCTNVPEDITFEQISNGWSLPYGDGGLVSDYCNSCTEYDNGNYEVKEMCERLYENAGKCETNMESYHYYGKQEGACDYITELLPRQKSRGGGGRVVGWLFFIIVIGALAGYVSWWRKKKNTGAAGSGDGLMA